MTRAALVLLFASACFAQPTWMGLRFGMSPDEAKRIVTDATEVAGDPSVRVLTAAAKVQDHAGQARLIFEKNALVRVGLVFEAGAKRCADVTPDQIIAADRLVQDIQEALREKYGRPVSSESRAAGRLLAWKDGRQVIQCQIRTVCRGSAAVTVFYEPASSRTGV